MTLFLVSLAGIPPTAGFFGKFWVLGAAVSQGHWVLAVIAVLTSVVSVFYYLRVVVVLYMKDAEYSDERPSPTLGVVLAASAILTLWLGVDPGALAAIATRSIELLR